MSKLLISILMTCLVLCSCTHLPALQNSNGTHTTGVDTHQGQAKMAGNQEESNAYYDFDDILIPKEMKLQPDESIMFETPNLKAGALRFEGNVEAVSLFNFFIRHMPDDNWRLRSYFKYERYLLVFEKPEKDCIIRIHNKRFNTVLYVWVTPRINGGEQTGFEEEILAQ